MAGNHLINMIIDPSFDHSEAQLGLGRMNTGSGPNALADYMQCSLLFVMIT